MEKAIEETAHVGGKETKANKKRRIGYFLLLLCSSSSCAVVVNGGGGGGGCWVVLVQREQPKLFNEDSLGIISRIR